MSLIGQTAVDAVFGEFGVDATYLPQSGDPPTTIRVVTKASNEIIDFGDSRILADTLLMEVRRNEVNPAQDDLINLNGQDYLIQAPPQILDTDQLVWTLDMRKA